MCGTAALRTCACVTSWWGPTLLCAPQFLFSTRNYKNRASVSNYFCWRAQVHRVSIPSSDGFLPLSTSMTCSNADVTQMQGNFGRRFSELEKVEVYCFSFSLPLSFRIYKYKILSFIKKWIAGRSDNASVSAASEISSGRARLGDVFHLDKLVLYIETVWCRGRTVQAFFTSTLRTGEWSPRSGRVVSWDRAPRTHWIEGCKDHTALEKRLVFSCYPEANPLGRSFIPNVNFTKSSRFPTDVNNGT